MDVIANTLRNLLGLLEYVCVLLVVFYILFKTKIFYKLKIADKDHHNFIITTIYIVFFGLLSIYGTISGFEILGAIANTRDLGPLIAGLLGGPIAGLGAGLIGATHRFFLGGFTGVPCSIATVIAGVTGGIIHHYSKGNGDFISPWKAALLAVIIESFHMVLVLLISRPFGQAVELVKLISLPMIVANTIGLALFSFMVNRFKKDQDMIIAEKEIESRVEVAHSLQTSILPQFLTSNQIESKEKDSFDWLIPYMTKENFKKDDVLFRKDDNADKIYYIKNGSIRLEEINKTVKKDEIIGETGIFSPFHKRTASAICETEVEAYTLSQEKINELLYKYPSLLFVLIQLSIQRVIVNLTETVTEKERIESELKIAHSIQTSILPKIFPEKKEFNIFAMMEPAKEVGGDFYDFFFIGENKFCFVIGDASGKGIPAALFMVISKTLIKTEALRNLPPDEILFRVNNILYPNNDECMFVTTFLAILDLKTGELQFSNAGHNPPLLFLDNKKFEFIDMDHGFVLGGMPDFKYTCQKLSLRSGGVIFLYTDGVTEAMDKEESLFSDERLRKSLSELTDTNVEGIVTDIRDKLKHFTGETPQSDDITMLALKFNSKKA